MALTFYFDGSISYLSYRAASANTEYLLNLIEWPGNLEMGIPHIDDQHRILVAIVNKLYANVSQGIRQGDLEERIDELLAYAEMHFECETRYFREYNFPSATAHEGEHANFVRIVKDCKARLAIDDKETATGLLYFLASWLSKHIGQEDHKLARAANLIRASSLSTNSNTPS
jgi:hemerythrin